jgi:putative transcriptional regulator
MEENNSPDLSGYITGQLLIAMPHMADPRFEKAVIYVCGHDINGAMGVIVNKYLGDLTLAGLLEHLNLPKSASQEDLRIYFGGPVDTGRGFILHSTDFLHPETIALTNDVALTATLDILGPIAEGKGPKDCLLAMGYTGWEAGQLDAELHGCDWLQAPCDIDILFHTPIEEKWDAALAKLGVSPEVLSEEAGQA